MGLLSIFMKDEMFVSWWWRIPFVASLLLVLIGTWARSGIPESQIFEEQKKAEKLSQSPIMDTIKYHWATVLKLTCCKIGENAFYYIITAYIVTFATSVGYSRS